MQTTTGPRWSKTTQQPRQPTPDPRRGRGWAGRGVVSLLAGLIAALLGFGVTGAGTVSAFAAGSDHTYIDLGAGGSYGTRGYALVSDSTDWRTELFGMVGAVRFRAESASGKPIFIGVADPGAVHGYLDQVAYTTVHRNAGDGETEHDGAAPSVPPEHAIDWVAHAHGSSAQTLIWDADNGALTLVAMNAAGRLTCEPRSCPPRSP